MNKIFLSLSLALAIISNFAFGGKIHEDVKKGDVKAVEKYITANGDVNVAEEVTGNTPLAIAIQQALPKKVDLKEYPFDQQTFLFIIKMLKCGLSSGAKNIITYLAENPYEDAIHDLTMDDNKSTVPSANCDPSGNCSTTTLEINDESCVTEKEIAAFVADVKRNAPNMVTSATDIISETMDFLAKYLFYEAGDSAQVKVIKLLLSKGAQIASGIDANIEKTRGEVRSSTDMIFQQSLVRLAADTGLFVLEVILSEILHAKISAGKAVRYPMNAIYLMTGIKTLIDARNTLSALYHDQMAVWGFAEVNNAITKK